VALLIVFFQYGNTAALMSFIEQLGTDSANAFRNVFYPENKIILNVTPTRIRIMFFLKFVLKPVLAYSRTVILIS